MSKFLIYEHESGEIVFVKRDEVGSFHPRYIQRNVYRTFTTVGKETYCIHQAESMEAAKKWIMEQIALIEKADVLAKEEI